MNGVGTVKFISKYGEFWYKLELIANEAPPIEMTMTSILGSHSVIFH